jgi:predicted dehydrogenase
MQDFVEAIATDRDPLAGIDLAADCIEVIYAAYLSAAEGRRVVLHEPRATSGEPRQDTP